MHVNFKIFLWQLTCIILPFSSKATMSVKSSENFASSTCWWGGPKGIINPPCKYKVGKSYYKHNTVRDKTNASLKKRRQLR